MEKSYTPPHFVEPFLPKLGLFGTFSVKYWRGRGSPSYFFSQIRTSYRISAQTITFPLPNMRLRLVRLMLSHQPRHMGQAQIRQTWKTIHEILRRR